MLSILLDIKEQQGVMTAQLMEAARSRARLEDSIKEVKTKVEKLEPFAETVKVMKPEHDELVSLKNRAAAVVVVSSVILTTAFGLIWTGLKSFGPEVGKLFSKWTA